MGNFVVPFYRKSTKKALLGLNALINPLKKCENLKNSFIEFHPWCTTTMRDI